MAELIDRAAVNAALEKLDALMRHRAETEDEEFLKVGVGITLASCEIDALPTVEAEPVVRCRDCENATMTMNDELKYCKFWQPEGGESLYLPGGGFCSEGKRMDADAPERVEGSGHGV